MKRFKWIYHALASKGLFAVLLVILCAILIPSTVTEERNTPASWVRTVVLGLMALNLLLCTLKRAGSLSMPVLVMHVGTLLILGGGVVSAFGFVGTVNMYEGSTVDKVYRPDFGDDVPLGMGLTVKKIHKEYYPVPVRVGVLRGEDKAGLFTLNTGESFHLDNYTIEVDAIQLRDSKLEMKVFEQGHFIGSADTSGTGNLPADFPYTFRLVAYKAPFFKRVWLDLRLSRGDEIVKEGTAEVNQPFSWQGMNFYHTRIDTDPYGMDYAGIQITKDPGRPYAYAGFAVLGMGSLMYLARRVMAHG